MDDVGGRLSWSALSSFIHNLGSDSALARDLGKSTGWEDTLTTNRILADIFDLLQAIRMDIRGLGGEKKKKKITPYPRPGADKNTRRIGQGSGLPYDKLREWIRSKQNGG